MDEEENLIDETFLVYSVLYSTITVVFAMAVLSKFLTHEFRFGIRSVLSLVLLFIGEPLCHFLLKGPQGVMAFGFGCLLVYSILPASHLSAANKAVVITGCDSGFGYALAKKLDSMGMVVFAGCLDVEGVGAIQLQNLCSQRLKVMQLDVTSTKQIDNCRHIVEEALRVGEFEGLWGLVNNAGLWYAGEAEMTSIKIFEKVMNINFLGTVRVTKAFLPLIRQGRGRIINMSSLSGKVITPCFAAYSASKHAIEGYSDALRIEMKKWGVIVSVVEPAGFRTGAFDDDIIKKVKSEIWDEMDEDTRATYGEEYTKQLFINYESLKQSCSEDLSQVVRAMRSGLLSKRPREYYPCGRGAETLLFLTAILPIWLSDKIADTVGIGVKTKKPLALY